MKCPKCGAAMFETSNHGIESFLCLCGYAYYPAYPKRRADGNVCEACGEEFKRLFNRKFCPRCQKLIGKNFKKSLKNLTAGSGVEILEGSRPWDDKKLSRDEEAIFNKLNNSGKVFEVLEGLKC